MAPRPFMAGEIEAFVDFLHPLSSTRPGPGVPLDFQRAYLRVSVIFVAKTAKLIRSIDPYVRRMHTSLQKQFFSIYVLAFDKDWLGEVDPEAQRKFEERFGELRTELQKGTVAQVDFDVEFNCVDRRGNRRKGRIIRYVAPLAKGTLLLSPEANVDVR